MLEKLRKNKWGRIRPTAPERVKGLDHCEIKKNRFFLTGFKNPLNSLE